MNGPLLKYRGPFRQKMSLDLHIYANANYSAAFAQACWAWLWLKTVLLRFILHRMKKYASSPLWLILALRAQGHYWSTGLCTFLRPCTAPSRPYDRLSAHGADSEAPRETSRFQGKLWKPVVFFAGVLEVSVANGRKSWKTHKTKYAIFWSRFIMV